MNKLTQRLTKIYKIFTWGDTETMQHFAQSMAEFERMRMSNP